MLRSTALRVVAGALSAGLLALVFLTALIGEPTSVQNIAPTFIYIVFWLGLVPLQVVFGNVWRVLNPWLAVADGVAWIWRQLGQDWTPPLDYPRRLGMWPGAVALALFAALELTYAEPASPRALALAVAIYSYAMWFGMAAFGRRMWDDHGNGFTGYFGLLARIAPFGEHEGRLVVRMPFSGLAGAERTPGMLAFIAVMLGSVGFDGLSRASFWQNLRADLEGPYIVDAPRTAELLSTGMALAGLLACILLVALAYRGATWIAEAMVESERPLAPEFLQSLVPIALVYAVAHYFTALHHHRPVHLLAGVGPVRVRVGSLRDGDVLAEHRALGAEHRLVRAGRRARRPATSRASWSRTTAQSRSCPRGTHSAPSTRCWG